MTYLHIQHVLAHEHLSPGTDLNIVYCCSKRRRFGEGVQC
jgi:hypothetical protein